MKHIAKGLLIASLLGVAGAAVAQAATDAPGSKREAAAAWTEDGLQKADIKGLDVVYTRPSVSLASYDKVLLKPVAVSFRRDWGRATAGAPGVRVRAADAQRIRERLATIMREEAIKQLGEGGYTVTDVAGDDVLEVEAAIVDLYIVAPDVLGAENLRTYSVSAGEMTLVAELRDSVSGETAARIYDHAYARETSRPHRITDVENTSEARRVASEWARQLRLQLDLAKRNAGAAD
jgi:hypothetical protein